MANKKKTRKTSKKKTKKTKAPARKTKKPAAPRSSKKRDLQVKFGLDPENAKCLCGCGQKVSKLFKQGHDARLKSRILKDARKIEDYKATAAQKAWFKTQNIKI